MASLPVVGQDVFSEKQTTVSNVRMTVNNLGSIGNSFKGAFNVEGFSSGEYPATSKTEHLFYGGLWIGTLVQGQTRVSTGGYDDSNGYNTAEEGYEFTASEALTERSSLLDNANYRPEAVSHQDFVSDFTDRNIFVGSIPIPEHTPIGADVHFESYNWNFSFADAFVILDFTITNSSTDIWENVYIGYWTDPVVRNLNITGAGSGGTAFYNKGGTGYLDTLAMCYEFDASSPDIPFTDSYFGVQFLGSELSGDFYHPQTDTGFFANFNSWDFRSTDGSLTTPQDDNQRYQRMSSSLTQRPEWADGSLPNSLRNPRNSSMMMSVGPYPAILPGETLKVSFAIVYGQKNEDGNPTSADTPEQKENLIENAEFAQSAYNGEDQNFNGLLDPGEDRDGNGVITRYVLPEPPSIPATRVVASERTIEVYWGNAAESSVDPISQEVDFEGYRIYKTEVGFDVQGAQDVGNALKLVGSWDLPNNGLFFDNGLDSIRLPEPVTFEGDTQTYHYKYTFTGVPSGWQHGVAVTAFDRGDEEIELASLESSALANLSRVFAGTPPNPSFSVGDPFVYPNPYYAYAEWEGPNRREDERRIVFANLPRRCNIRIYTVAGDFIAALRHDEGYDGSDIRWTNTYAQADQTVFSGGEHAWDLLSTDQQIIARGIYLFSVEDLDSGEIRQGKFVVIK